MNQSYEQDQCFIPKKKGEDSVELKKQKQLQIDVTHIIKIQLPSGNDLQLKTRPSHLHPRTCFTQLPLHLLPSEINSPCIQQIGHPSSHCHKQPLLNKHNLTLFEYFNDEQEYTLIYDKLSKYREKSFDLEQEETVRFKNISFLLDYNEKQYRQLQQPSTITVKNKTDSFCSEFQCGNLGQVYAYNYDRKYYLLLQNDVNSHGYTNWFFFKVNNAKKGRIRMHIVNMVKNTTMFRQGMKVSIFDEKKYKKQKIKWFKGGQNIYTSSTPFQKPNKPDQYFSSLYFEYDFEYENDQVYFALSQPYTYSRLISTIQKVKQQADKKQVYFHAGKPIYTISNNIIPIIHLHKGQQPLEDRKVIIFLGRQHPSQVVGSFVMEGIMEYILSDSEEADAILRKYRVVMIPMVNPDGVIHGNSRCNMAGYDLNRRWSSSELKELTPETYYLRKLIFKFHSQSKGIEYVIDSHGHSKKLNSFMFCCKMQDKFKNYEFPLVMSKLECRFDLYSCTYGISKDKLNTIRGQLYEAGIRQCYTLQNSYYGYNSGTDIQPYNQKQLKQIGKSIVRGLSFICQENNPTKILMNYGFNRSQLQMEFSKNQKNILKINKQRTKNDNEICSDSDPQGDVLNLEERINICSGVSEAEKIKLIKRMTPLQKKSLKEEKSKIKIKKEEGFVRRTFQDKSHKTLSISKNHKSEERLKSSFMKQKPKSTEKNRKKPVQNHLDKIKTQSRPVSRQNQQITVIDHISKGFSRNYNKKNFPSFIYKYPGYLPKKTDKTNRVHSGFKKQILKHIQSKVLDYEELKKEENQASKNLNQTLSIISMEKSVEKDKGQKLQKEVEGSLNAHLTKSRRVRTQITYERKDSSAGEPQFRKKWNLKQQMLKRKISLQKRKDDSRYRRFENFRDGHLHKKQQHKKMQNTVFYYFPVL